MLLQPKSLLLKRLIKVETLRQDNIRRKENELSSVLIKTRKAERRVSAELLMEMSEVCPSPC